MKENGSSLRLVPLLDIIADADDVHDAKSRLLGLCIAKEIPAYVAVPPGHVVFKYRHPSIRLTSEMKVLSGGYQVPMVLHAKRPILQRSISYLRLGNFDLTRICDARAVVVDQFFSGGLVAWGDGLGVHPFEYGVVSLGRFPYIEDGQWIADAQVKGNGLTISLSDIYINSEDAIELRRLMEPEDRHNLKGRADGTYLLYWAAFTFAGSNPYDEKGIKDFLIGKDESHVFVSAVIDVAINMIKKGLSNTKGKPGARELRTDLIEKNKFGKSYREPFLSDRMCLILYATECWLHDSDLNRTSEDRVAQRIGEINTKTMDPRDKDNAIFEFRQSEVSSLKKGLYMPNGLRSHLAEIGFLDSGATTQAMHLEKIIKNVGSGGRHASTKKEALTNSKMVSKKSVGIG